MSKSIFFSREVMNEVSNCFAQKIETITDNDPHVLKCREELKQAIVEYAFSNEKTKDGSNMDYIGGVDDTLLSLLISVEEIAFYMGIQEGVSLLNNISGGNLIETYSRIFAGQ
ncbi:MAG TPA: hypothetical protein DD738_15740 [Ruminiclostridium sp.]|nr:hypothetical protein [Bacillota bacterium]HBR04051.1 hypothetical protein [Ruminiclostridium sp.]